MRKIFGLLCLLLAILGVVNLVRQLAGGSSTPPPAHIRNNEAYEAGRKVGLFAPPFLFGALALWLLGGGGGAARPAPVRRPQSTPILMRRGPAPAPASGGSGLVLPLKIECGCGQHYAFDVQPVNGRMPYTVKCPACGADGTEVANGIIAQLLAVPAGPSAGGTPRYAPAPGSGGSKLPWIIAGAAGGALVCVLLVGLVFVGLRPRLSGPPRPMPNDFRRAPGPQPLQAEAGPSAFKTGDKVEVFWVGKWQPGTVTGQRGPTVQVAFDDPATTHIPQIWMITNQVRLRK